MDDIIRIDEYLQLFDIADDEIKSIARKNDKLIDELGHIHENMLNTIAQSSDKQNKMKQNMNKMKDCSDSLERIHRRHAKICNK